MPVSDIGKLREYLVERFAEQRRVIGEYGHKIQHGPSTQAIFELSARAVAFRHELVSWQAFAQRLYDEGHAARTLVVRDTVREELLADKTHKRSAKEIEIIVRGQIAPLKQALELITLTVDQLKNVIFWAQAMSHILPQEELIESQPSAAEYDESIFILPVIGAEAPIEESLRQMEIPRVDENGQLTLGVD
jgi:hypothetical protein